MDNKIYSSKYLTRAGILFFLAGLIILMGIITAEAYYPSTPAYTTHNSMISDLGATEPPNSVITQPSATIFNLSMILTGILILAGTFFLVRYNKNKIAMVLFGLLGLGVLGVGIFPGNIHPQHPLFAMLTFISGGLAAIYSYRLINSTFKFLALILGLITLFFLFTNQIFTPVLGGGGLERWVAYPIIIWMIGFGGYIAGVSSK
ncbi:MAG: DUF998 domain-containing protein [Methanobacterium sp.]|nr:DUF998 domain-containing protein [Methanobacterium sp.]